MREQLSFSGDRWSRSCPLRSMRRLPRPEVVIGRSLAVCVHPYAAWRMPSAKTRVLLVFAYAVASYATTLAILMMR